MTNDPVKTLKDVERLLFSDVMTVMRVQMALQIAYNLGQMHAKDDHKEALERLRAVPA